MNIRTLNDTELEQELQKKQMLATRLDTLRAYAGRDRVVKITELAREMADKPKARVYESGLGALDATVGGFKGGEVVVVSGPTGQGKTTFLQTLTYGFADRGVGCLWFSYEVVADDFLDRFADRLPMFVLPREIVPSSTKWLEQRIWEGIAKYQVKVVFVDHLHFLLNMADLANANSSIALGFLMREIKRIALETNTIIFLVSHLRKTELEKAPSISDLRDSSFVGQESDMVFMVWRETKLNSEDMQIYGSHTYLRVDKNRRKGLLETFKMRFDTNKFYLVSGDDHE